MTYGRLPRSDDGLDQFFQPNLRRHQEGYAPDFVIFISYTRINRDPNARTPDDTNNTQYRRMLRAIEQFLALHPFVDRDCLSIWVVSAQSIDDICSFIVYNPNASTGSRLRRPRRSHARRVRPAYDHRPMRRND